MKGKFLVLIALAVLSAGLLAGCAGEEGQQVTTPAEEKRRLRLHSFT